MTVFHRFYDFARRLDSLFGMAAMAFIILLACANVFMRYVIGRPWGWVEEVTVFTFVWLTMLGASATVHAEGHCSIDVLVRRFPAKWRRAVAIVSDSIVLATLILLIVYGIQLTIKGQTKLTPILGIPYSYVDAAVPVSCGLMLMYYGRMFWNSVRGKTRDGAPDGGGEEESAS
ncbi:MAG: TRAP transporter small permease [Candidatus Accumulibacter sp.]|jgi:TRAP-type C4-dicarboxylate transport system permease small subunit|nr:TRAP transporter small permease [Accumulibacter sp.]